MSDKRDEIQEEEDQDLQEFKADGEKSSTADPVGKKTPKRRGDKDQGEKETPLQGSSKKPNGKSKPSLISNAVKLMGEMEEEELQSLISKLNGDELDEEDDKDDKVELKKITTEDVDVSDDVEAMFKDDEELSEEFKTKATNIFEHAVVAKVNEILENAYVDAYSDREALAESVMEDLTEKLDDYLDYVINEWVDDNQLAIDKGIYADLTESFMSGLKSLFEEHYIDIPEDRVDIVDELVERTEELEENINELTESNVELFSRVKEYEQERVIDELSDDLTESQKDKLRSLAEGINFKDIDDYEARVSILKENYFGDSDDDSSDMRTLSEDHDDTILLDEEERDVPANMKSYLNAISRHAKAAK